VRPCCRWRAPCSRCSCVRPRSIAGPCPGSGSTPRFRADVPGAPKMFQGVTAGFRVGSGRKRAAEEPVVPLAATHRRAGGRAAGEGSEIGRAGKGAGGGASRNREPDPSSARALVDVGRAREIPRSAAGDGHRWGAGSRVGRGSACRPEAGFVARPRRPRGPAAPASGPSRVAMAAGAQAAGSASGSGSVSQPLPAPTRQAVPFGCIVTSVQVPVRSDTKTWSRLPLGCMP